MVTWEEEGEGVLVQGDDDEVSELLANVVAHLLTAILEELCEGNDGKEVN